MKTSFSRSIYLKVVTNSIRCIAASLKTGGVPFISIRKKWELRCRKICTENGRQI